MASQLNLGEISVDVVFKDIKNVHLTFILRQAVCASPPLSE